MCVCEKGGGEWGVTTWGQGDESLRTASRRAAVVHQMYKLSTGVASSLSAQQAVARPELEQHPSWWVLGSATLRGCQCEAGWSPATPNLYPVALPLKLRVRPCALTRHGPNVTKLGAP